jgi:hypothetical protein
MSQIFFAHNSTPMQIVFYALLQTPYHQNNRTQNQSKLLFFFILGATQQRTPQFKIIFMRNHCPMRDTIVSTKTPSEKCFSEGVIKKTKGLATK